MMEQQQLQNKNKLSHVLSSPVGKGGFSKVFKSLNRFDGLIYAIKHIPWNPQDMDSIIRVVAEVRILARMSGHPNVVTYYDAWLEENNGTPPTRLLEGDQESDYDDNDTDRSITRVLSMSYRCCIQMELCDKSVREYLKERTEIYTPQTRALFQQVLEGVNHLHKHDIIHGDLKPENILLRVNTEGTLVAKISDFGLSTYLHDDNITTTVGTPLYTAPEHHRTALSDVFSLGIILLEFFSMFVTQMERILTIRSLRQTGIPPKTIEQDQPVVFLMIRMMVSEDPLLRPNTRLLRHIFRDEPSSDINVMCRDIVWEILFDVLDTVTPLRHEKLFSNRL